ncbi:MAG: MotA/TolQ/ExbB proton channel family protein, partial [Bdellovibrionales bacterium]|nr:MotA/TolQ/ExbB proton channel family protein [Bdellovibrionales bacterium]
MQTIIVFLNWAEKGVLILLAVLSIWSVGIMIDRRRVFRKSYRANDIKEAERFINNRDPSEATVTKVESNRIMSTLMSRLLNNPNQTLESLEPDFRNWLHGQKLILSKHLNVLATLGANAPFIGLLGTVFGIIEAFSELSN